MGLDEIIDMKTLAHSSYSNQGRQPEGESISPLDLERFGKVWIWFDSRLSSRNIQQAFIYSESKYKYDAGPLTIYFRLER